MKELEAIVMRIRELLETKQTVLVAIDGYGGAGKTTLAKQIQAVFAGSQIVTLDSFATDTLNGADRNRFRADVLNPLSTGQIAKYQPFIWKERKLGEWVEAKAEGVVLIEGVSVLGMDFISFYDLRIWIDCPFDLAQQRMKERERKSGHNFSLSNYFNVWKKEDWEYGLTEPWKRADIIAPMAE